MEGSIQLPVKLTDSNEIALTHLAYSGRPNNQRVHSLFNNPLIGCINFKTDLNELKSLKFEYINPLIENIWNTYEDSVKHSSTSEGFDNNSQKELFICYENPINLEKIIVLISTNITDPKGWYIRHSTDRRTVGGNYNFINKKYLRKLTFKTLFPLNLKPNESNINETTVTEIDLDLGNDQIKFYGLLHPTLFYIYAIRVNINIMYANEVIIQSSNSVLLDYDRILEDE